MPITEEIKTILKDKQEEMEKKPDYRKFVDKYNDLIERGIIKKQKYEIPPIDTIGARLYQNDKQNILPLPIDK